MRSTGKAKMGALGFAGWMLAMTAACVGDDPLLAPGTSAPDSGGGSTSDSGASLGDGGGLTPDAAPPANCPLNCLPHAPAGWTGPSAVYDGPFANAPAECPAQYTIAEVTAKRDLDVPATTCACGTPTFSGASCNFTTTDYTGSGCQYGVTTTTQVSGGCFEHAGTALKIANATLATSGACQFPSPVPTKPAPVPGTATKACGLPQTASCSAERADCTATPLPSSPFTRLCIHKAGDEPCPSADYAVRLVSHLDVVDDRDCSACTGTAAGGTCPTTFGWSNTTGCANVTGNQRAIGSTCWTSEGNRLVFYNPTGMTCSVATPGTPTGGVQPAGPVTFCCAK